MVEGWGEKRSGGIFFSGFGMHEHGGGALIVPSDCVSAALIYVGVRRYDRYIDISGSLWLGNGSTCNREVLGVNQCCLLPLLSRSPISLNASRIHPAHDRFSILLANMHIWS